MRATFAKPVSPVWQPGKAPAGCKLYLPLAEGAGTTVRDYAGGLVGSFVGTPTWERGLYGPQLGGFTTSNYVAIDPPTQILGLVYPSWVAVLCTASPSGGSSTAIEQASSSAQFGAAMINFSANAGSNNATFSCRSNTGSTGHVSVSSPGIYDGRPCVLMGVLWSASYRELYINGRLAGSSAATITGSMACDRLTVGVLRRQTTSEPWLGSLLWAGAGNGAVPDPVDLAQDKLSGWFAAIRHQSNLALWAALAPTPVAPTGSPAAMMMGF